MDKSGISRQKKIDRQLKDLWHSFTDTTGYTTPAAFKRALDKLKPDLSSQVSVNRIRKVLSEIPSYARSLRKKRLVHRRGIDYRALRVGAQLQVDVAQMTRVADDDGDVYAYYILAVDVFDNYVMAKAMRTKTAAEVYDCLQAIFAENDILHTIESIGWDAAREFVSLAPRLKRQGIRTYIYRGKNKSFLAEKYISVVNRRLFFALRANLSDNWVNLLPIICRLVNNSLNKSFFYLFSSSELHSPFFEPLLRYLRLLKGEEELAKRPVKLKQEVPFKLDDYVYAELQDKGFEKSYDMKRGTIYQVAAVDTRREPYMYKLKELNGKAVRGNTCHGNAGIYIEIIPFRVILRCRVDS